MAPCPRPHWHIRRPAEPSAAPVGYWHRLGHPSSSYVLAYGAGASPTTWTSFAGSPNGLSSQGTLGAWATFGLTGVYTLRLTATDYAGNATVVTDTVYLDNTERGAETYYASVPFDLGGGWNLGVQPVTGEATLSRDCFSIPFLGPAQSLSVSYSSGDTGTGGQLGQGWSSTSPSI